MRTLIHGDDTAASRKALDDLKAKYTQSEIITSYGTKVTLTDVITATNSSPLFTTDRVIIIENLISATPPANFEAILNYLTKNKITASVIFWEGREVGKTIMAKYFKNEKVILCKLPQLLFNFLDSVGEKPLSYLLKLLHNLIRIKKGEIIFAMLVRQIRNLLIAKDLGAAGLKAVSFWQAQKFMGQSRYFTQERLILSYRQLLNIDWKIKTGQSPYTVNQLLDIFLISLYHQF